MLLMQNTETGTRKRRAEPKVEVEKEVEVLGPAVRRSRKTSPEVLRPTIQDRLGLRQRFAQFHDLCVTHQCCSLTDHCFVSPPPITSLSGEQL